MKTLALYLRGGQTIELRVSDWELFKSNVTGELTKLTWEMADENTRAPFVRIDSIDAVIVRDK